MAQMMIDDSGPYGEVLTDEDFPASFIHMAHPNDNVAIAASLPIEFIFNDVPHHKRILVRMSFQIRDGYYPVTFVADTGAPSSFYLVRHIRSEYYSQ